MHNKVFYIPKKHIKHVACQATTMEGANKQVISSQADSLIKISRIWADFFPANTSNQPI
ncbi:ABC transporter domain protein [Escherichia coli 1-182-04_S3_C2]|nr:ABC transporter domain protein [Escherichia coli 1-182-04_S3_C2]